MSLSTPDIKDAEAQRNKSASVAKRLTTNYEMTDSVFKASAASFQNLKVFLLPCLTSLRI